MNVQASIVICAALLLSSGYAQAGDVPRLPTPSGPFGIGRAGYDWTDTSRHDRFSSDPQAHRELMVYLWYPAARTAKEAHGAYLPGAKRMDMLPGVGKGMRENYGDNWPLILSGAVYSHAVDGAPVAKNPNKFPLVLFSHGLGSSGFGYTALIENLVSHGYVVAAIDHTYTADAVAFPDGRVIAFHRDPAPTGLSPEEGLKRMMASAGAEITEGAADVRFVLTKLTELNGADGHQFPFAGRLDLAEVAAMGHSAGAEFAALACILDARFKACVDLDGAMYPVGALPVGPDDTTIQQPLLFLEVLHPESKMFGTHEEHMAFYKTKEEQLAHCPKGSYDVVLNPPGMMHGSYSDTFLFQMKNRPAELVAALHNLDLTQSYILAFLDKNLKHASAPLLDDPNSPHPDATIQHLGK